MFSRVDFSRNYMDMQCFKCVMSHHLLCRGGKSHCSICIQCKTTRQKTRRQFGVST